MAPLEVSQFTTERVKHGYLGDDEKSSLRAKNSQKNMHTENRKNSQKKYSTSKQKKN